jgi:hypothetical protein
MSFKQVSTLAAAAAATISLSAVAYGDTGKSPNGAPGPAGNPNYPAATPQANGPVGPAGNDAHGQSNPGNANQNASPTGKSNSASHGKSNASHGKSNSAPRGHAYAYGKSKSHGNSQGTHGNSAQGKANNFGHGKITICHATKSVKNPYVEITISVNGLHGHGPADDPRHHEGSWQDIIPAPAGGCPSEVQPQGQPQGDQHPTQQPQVTQSVAGLPPVAPVVPEVATFNAPNGVSPQSMVLGERVAGVRRPAKKSTGATKVLGANAAGGNAPGAALAVRHVSKHASLPFTGLELAIILIAAAAALLGGVALRRATRPNS